MVRVGGGLVRGRGQRVALRRGVPLQHGRGAAQRPEPHHQRPVRVRPDAHARPQRLALCNVPDYLYYARTYTDTTTRPAPSMITVVLCKYRTLVKTRMQNGKEINLECHLVKVGTSKHSKD